MAAAADTEALRPEGMALDPGSVLHPATAAGEDAELGVDLDAYPEGAGLTHQLPHAPDAEARRAQLEQLQRLIAHLGPDDQALLWGRLAGERQSVLAGRHGLRQSTVSWRLQRACEALAEVHRIGWFGADEAAEVRELVRDEAPKVVPARARRGVGVVAAAAWDCPASCRVARYMRAPQGRTWRLLDRLRRAWADDQDPRLVAWAHWMMAPALRAAPQPRSGVMRPGPVRQALLGAG